MVCDSFVLTGKMTATTGVCPATKQEKRAPKSPQKAQLEKEKTIKTSDLEYSICGRKQDRSHSRVRKEKQCGGDYHHWSLIVSVSKGEKLCESLKKDKREG